MSLLEKSYCSSGMTKCAHGVPPLPRGLCWRSIRSCQIPIGRAQRKKLKFMAQPYKTKALKKKSIEFDVDGIEIGDNPIGA